ncbi:MAG: hypothetical protein KBF21_07620 [Thermoanaerobaculia bacterium]|nr:hypothetical protein [Thermoanaerobaculia bacterium]
MRNQLLAVLDIVLSARLVNANVIRIAEEAHKAADPHLALALVSARGTTTNPVEIALDLEMLDAAVDCAKEALAEIEKIKRVVSKNVVELEAAPSLPGGDAAMRRDAIQENLDEIDEGFQICGARLQEMETVRDIADKRRKALVARV